MVWALKFGPYGEQLALAWKEGQVSGGAWGHSYKSKGVRGVRGNQAFFLSLLHGA